jgi:hypothetical protein
MRSISMMFLSALLAVISGCGSPNSTSFRSMSHAYREVVESYSNDNILINIARASKKMPVSFLDIPSIMGTGSVSADVGLSATVYSGNPGSLGGFLQPWAGAVGLANYIPTASLSVSGGYTFTQSSLDNATFMRPFLLDIKPEIVAYLTSNHAAPKSILYSLLVSSIDVVNDKREVVSSFVNDPSSKDYLGFQRALYILVAAGLTAEPTFVKMPMSPILDEKLARDSFGMLVGALAAGVTLDEVSQPGRPKQFRLIKLMPDWRLCLNKTDGEVLFGKSLSPENYCTQSYKSTTAQRTATELRALLSDGSDSGLKNLSIKVNLRSTRNIFDFLGDIVAMQNAENPHIVKVFNPELLNASDNAKVSDFPPVPLFVMQKNKSVGKPLTSLNYRGDTYTVPDHDISESFTKEVIVLLSQLLTLNKISGSIPPSPSVLVR